MSNIKRETIRNINTRAEHLIDDIDENESSLEPSARETVIAKSLDHLLSTNDMDIKSRVKSNQVLILTKFRIFARHFKSPIADIIADQILKLNVSIDGQGRKEITEIVRSLPSENADESIGLAEKLFNVRK